MPPVILAFGWSELLTYGTVLGGARPVLFGPAGFILVTGVALMPLVVLFTVTGLSQADHRLEEAGRLCAGRCQVLKGITLPLVLRPYRASLLLVFCLSLGEAGVPTFLRVPVFSVESMTQFAAFYDFGAAAAASLPLLVITGGAFALIAVTGIRDFGALKPVSSTDGQPLFRLGAWGAWVLGGLSALWFATAGLPLGALLARSLGASAYREALVLAGGSYLRSLAYSAAGATLVLVLGFLVAHGLAWRSLPRWSGWLPLLLFALPGPVLGIGLIALWGRASTAWIYGSPAVLVLGLLAQYLVLGVWISQAALAQVPRSLEESAAVSGIPWGGRLRGISIPLVWQGLLAAWLVAFLFCMRDTGLSMVVYPPGGDPLPARLFTLMANGRPEVISAICVLVVVLSLALFAALALVLRGRQP
jgi:iron(III) transport system permease protein